MSRSNAPSSKDRLAIFDEVWQTIRDRYYDANLRDVNWDEQRTIYRTHAANAANTNAFYGVLRRMVGSLHDSHTRVYAPAEKFDWRNPRIISTGVSIREIENKFVVFSLEKDSAAVRAGVRAGDVVTSIDGIPAETVFAHKINEQTGISTASATRLWAAANILEGAAGTIVRVGFQNAQGIEYTATLERNWRALSSGVRVKRAGAMLVIAFDTFTPELVGEFHGILGTHLQHGVRGIVLDLRANRGGSTEAMIDIASAFLPENKNIGKFIDRTGKVAVEVRTRRGLMFTARATRVKNLPTVVLTSTATASAAEIFTAALKAANQVKTVGAVTCGCVLAVKGQHALPDGGALEISELDFQLPNGTRLEGIGVTPDEKISLIRKDILARHDLALKRALEILRQK